MSYLDLMHLDLNVYLLPYFYDASELPILRFNAEKTRFNVQLKNDTIISKHILNEASISWHENIHIFFIRPRVKMFALFYVLALKQREKAGEKISRYFKVKVFLWHKFLFRPSVRLYVVCLYCVLHLSIIVVANKM